MANAAAVGAGLFILLIGIILFLVCIFVLKKGYDNYSSQKAPPFSSKTMTGWVLLNISVSFFLIGMVVIILGTRVKHSSKSSRINPEMLELAML